MDGKLAAEEGEGFDPFGVLLDRLALPAAAQAKKSDPAVVGWARVSWRPEHVFAQGHRAGDRAGGDPNRESQAVAPAENGVSGADGRSKDDNDSRVEEPMAE
jgi:hypothetical protein